MSQIEIPQFDGVGRVALPVAARRRESLAGKPRGIGGGKEYGDAGNIIRLPRPRRC